MVDTIFNGTALRPIGAVVSNSAHSESNSEA
jgi:hypothetical protein